MSEKTYAAAVITVSDRCAAGQREDLSGPAVVRELRNCGFRPETCRVVPDDVGKIAAEIVAAVDSGADLVLTTGGTGFGPRDVTPEATASVIEKRADGIACAMLFNALSSTDRAMLTRGIAGICGKSLVINLPGSPRAAAEDARYVLPAVRHGLEVLRGETKDCGK